MIDDLKIEAKKLHKLDKIVKEKHLKEVSFEFIVGSLFPQALKNIKEEMRRQYTLGYSAGIKEDESIEIKNSKPMS